MKTSWLRMIGKKLVERAEPEDIAALKKNKLHEKHDYRRGQDFEFEITEILQTICKQR